MRTPVCKRCKASNENMIAINSFFGRDTTNMETKIYITFQCAICGEVVIVPYE